MYFGANADTVAKLFPKVGVRGLFNIVQCGSKFGKPVVSQVGRVHYGAIRVIGTAGSDPAEAMSYIPATAEIRAKDKINIIGAAGPMGTMHVIRDLCQGVPDVTVFAGDLSDDRLLMLQKLAKPLAQKNKVSLRTYNPSKEKLSEQFNYIVLMAPVPALVVQSVASAAKRGIINIFAGIAAHVTAELDLDAYIAKQLYFIGTSGSTLDDMKLVLAKVLARPARYQSVGGCRVGAGRSNRGYPGLGEEPDAGEDSGLPVMQRPEADAVDGTWRRTPAPGRRVEQTG